MESLNLIQSKLAIPRYSGAVSRPRLENAVAKILAKKVLMVTAPAGFGKTTLVGEALKQIDADIIWYSLDEFDRDFRIFFSYLAHGVGEFHEIFLSEALEKLSIKIMDENFKKEFIYYFTALIENSFKKESILVFDDFHLIGNQIDILNFLEFFLSNLPEKFHVIFITRSIPEIKFSRYKSLMSFVEIDEEDLLFTRGEIKDLATCKLSGEYGDELVKHIEKATGGWAAAITLYLYNFKDRTRKDQILSSEFIKSKKSIFQYIDENIFSDLSCEKRDFMVKSSLLKRLDMEVCNLFLKEYQPEIILRELAEEHLLTSIYDKPLNSFNYHPLLKEFLNEKLKIEIDNQEIKTLYKKIGDFYKDRGNTELSLVYYLEGGLYGDLTDLVNNFILKDMVSFSLDLINDAMERIPEKDLEVNPDLIYLKSRIYSIKGNFTSSLFLLKNALELFQRQKNEFGELNCLKDIGFHHYIRGEMAEAVNYLELVIERGKEHEYIFLEAGGLLLFFLSVSGEFKKAEDLYSFLMEDLEERNCGLDDFSKNWIKLCFIFRYQNDGDFTGADLHYKTCMDFFLSRDATNILPLVLFHKSLLEYSLFKYNEGIKTAKSGLEIIGERGVTDHQPGWLRHSLCLNYLGLNRFDEALIEAKKNLRFFMDREYPWGCASVYCLIAMIHYEKADYFSSYENLKKGLNEIKDKKIEPLKGRLYNLQGFIFLKTCKKEELIKLIDSKKDEMTNTVFNRFSFYILVLESKIISDDSNKYLDYCEKLIELIKKYQYQDQLFNYKNFAGNFLLFCIDKNISKEFCTGLMGILKKEILFKDPGLSIRCFGHFKVKINGFDLDSGLFEGTNPGRIFKYLVLKADKGLVKKDQLMELLWPDQDPEITKGRFHVEMSKLRKILEPGLKKGEASRFILSKKDSYGLNSEVSIDTNEFLSEIKKGDKDSKESLNHLLMAEEIYKGHLFNENEYDDFFIDQGEYFKNKYLELLNKIILFYHGKGNILKALVYSRKYLENSPHEESAYRRIMGYYSILGENGKIREIFELCKKNIENEFDTPLSEKTISLFNSLIKSAS